MKDDIHEVKHFVKHLLAFVFIFIIIIAAVFSLHYSGIFDFDALGETTTDTTEGLDILPSDTTVTTEADTTSQTTETTTEEQSQTETTETTEKSTKYPPATIPSLPTKTTQTTNKTLATTKTTLTTHTTTETTTAETTATEKPPVTSDPHKITAADITDEKMAELITKKYLTVHSKSRPGYKLWSVKNIVVHYVANPGTSALQNWKYFENKNNVSAHFIIDIDGSIIQCMPTDEVAWAVGTKNGNYTSISIECCHPDSTGEFTEATYTSLLKLVSWLCAEYDLDRDDVIRHYDYGIQKSWGVYHKACPLYYANDKEPASHERWKKFQEELYIK